jgi:leucyl-tRNA synthetase
LDTEPDRQQLKILHETIKKVTEDIEGGRYNTAISQLMIFNNEAIKWEQKPKSVQETFLVLLSPFAPHISEELWARLGHTKSISSQEWPKYHESFLEANSFTYAIQVNGKVRATLQVEASLAENKDAVLAMAKREASVAKYLSEGTLIKEIFVPKKIINFVVN